jgi:hypothetical protein
VLGLQLELRFCEGGGMSMIKVSLGVVLFAAMVAVSPANAIAAELATVSSFVVSISDSSIVISSENPVEKDPDELDTVSYLISKETLLVDANAALLPMEKFRIGDLVTVMYLAGSDSAITITHEGAGHMFETFLETTTGYTQDASKSKIPDETSAANILAVAERSAVVSRIKDQGCGTSDEGVTAVYEDGIVVFCGVADTCTVALYDVRGSLIFSKKHEPDPNDNDTIVVLYEKEYGDLGTGIYLYQIKHDDETLATGKFVVVK